MSNLKAVKWIYEKAGKVRRAIYVLALINVVLSVISVRLAIASKELIDSAVSDPGGIARRGIYLAALILLQLAIQSVYSVLMVKTDGKIKINLRTYIFNMLLKKDFGSVGKYHTGELLTRINSDTDVIATGLMVIIPETVSVGAQILLSFAALFSLDRYLALLCLAAVPFIAAAACFYSKFIKPLHKKCQSTGGAVRSFMIECLQSLFVIKCFIRENEATSRCEKLQYDNYKAVLKRNSITITGSIMFYLLLTAGFYFSMYWCTVKISAGVMTFGTLTAVLQLVGNIQAPIKSVSGIMPQLYSSVASAERITELEEMKDDIPCAHTDIGELYKDLISISFKNVSFKYDKDPVLENADVTVNKGEFIAVGGDSGIGKSTMFKLMTSVLVPDKGEIVFDTKSGTAKSAADYRGIFAYVPQTNMLISGSVFENIAFFDKTVTREGAENAAKLACIFDTVNDMQNGFDTVLGEGGAGLSEGQIQRIAIARAIAADLPFILLDEATSALDSETEKQILNNLKELKNKTIIAISHRPEVFNICTAVITIENGKMKKEIRV